MLCQSLVALGLYSLFCEPIFPSYSADIFLSFACVSVFKSLPFFFETGSYPRYLTDLELTM